MAPLFGHRATLADDIEAARTWWDNVRVTLPDEGVAGLWFGIFDGKTDAGSGRQLYVSGTEVFDADDETGDWAADEFVWWPRGRYVALKAFRKLPEDPYEDVLAHAIEVVRGIAPWTRYPGLGVAVGFDDGDLEVVHRP